MKRLIVFSDSHGNPELLRRAAGEHFGKPDTVGVIYLGDGYSDLAAIDTQGMTVWQVRGNCDEGIWGFGDRSDLPPRELMVELDGWHILLMHGHTHGVKSGWERAAAYAHARGADILMFGHTHEMLEKYIPAGSDIGGVVTDRPMYVFNPGTAGVGIRRSYCVVDITPGGVLMSHAAGDPARRARR